MYGVNLKDFYKSCANTEESNNTLLTSQKIYIPKKVMDKIKVDANHWRSLIEKAGGVLLKDKEKE